MEVSEVTRNAAASPVLTTCTGHLQFSPERGAKHQWEQLINSLPCDSLTLLLDLDFLLDFEVGF